MGSRKNRLANEVLRLKQATVELKERAINRQNLANDEESRIQQSLIEAKERADETLAIQYSIEDYLNNINFEHKAIRNALIQAFKQYKINRRSDEIARMQEHLEFQNDMKAKVNDIYQEVQMSLHEFHNAHFEMTKSLQKDFKAYQKSILYAEKERQNISAELGKELVANFLNLQQDTAELLQSFNEAHREMSKLQHHSLEKENRLLHQQAKLDRENRLEFLYELLDLDFGIKKKKL